MEKQYNLLSIISILLGHIVFIVIITIIAGLSAFFISTQFIPKEYTSKAQLYVENKTTSDEAINVNDITVAQKLVNTCTIIFKSDSTMNELAKDEKISFSAKELSKMISISSVNNTEIMEIKVTCNDPAIAHTIADKMVEVCSKRYQEIIASGTISVVDSASYSESPSSPNIFLNTLIGVVLGFALSSAFVLAKDLLDSRVKPADDLSTMYDVPVFADIMDFDAKKSKFSYEYKQ